jgi:flagellin-like protein
MTSRRAVSPVIATVILIAVAVALGIAVAVWAGALTGGLQKQEKLIINAYESGGAAPQLNLAVTNQSPGTATVTQILFNQQPITGSAPAIPDTLASGGVATIVITLAHLPMAPISGITYPITVVTAAGNSYPSTITWP